MNPHPRALEAMDALLDSDTNPMRHLLDSGMEDEVAGDVVRYMYNAGWISGIRIEPADGSFELLEPKPEPPGVQAVYPPAAGAHTVINNSGPNSMVAMAGDNSTITQTMTGPESSELVELLRELLSHETLDDDETEAAEAALEVLAGPATPAVRRVALKHASKVIRVGGDLARIHAAIEQYLTGG